MTDLDRYIRHPASTSTGATSWLYKERPFGAGRHQTILCNNALRLVRANSVRPLCTHNGVRGLWRAALGGTTNDPNLWDIDWTLTPKQGGCALDLGVHWVWRYGAGDTRYPTLICRVRGAVEDAGDTLGVFVGVAPGERFLAPDDLYDHWHHTGDTLYTEKTLVIPLGETSVASKRIRLVGGTSTADPEEVAELLVFRVFLGAYNSAGTNTLGRLANLLGISLFLEPPG